jgi:hypothetical protein
MRLYLRRTLVLLCLYVQDRFGFYNTRPHIQYLIYKHIYEDKQLMFKKDALVSQKGGKFTCGQVMRE